MPLSWNELTLSLAASGRVYCDARWRLDDNWSRRLLDYDLWLVCAGQGSMRLHDRRIELRPGICLWMRPGGRYLAEQCAEARLCVNCMHFDLRDSQNRRPSDDQLPPEAHDLADYRYTEAVMMRIMELQRRSRLENDAGGAALREAAIALLRGVLMDMDITATDTHALHPLSTGSAGNPRQLVLSLIARIRDSRNGVPSVAELAEMLNYNPDHFTRLFRKFTGQCPQEFIVSLRIERAQQLLRESSLTISQIADALHYRDVYFFSRQFKQKTGVSPMQYRNPPA